MLFQSPPVPLEQTPEGVIQIIGSRVSLDSVIFAFKQGETPESIAESYTTVALADVYAVIAYYLHRQAEIDAYLEAGERRQDEIRQELENRFGKHPTRDELLRRPR